jgi:uncharacterized C2H2 Zn-finger protein
MSGYGKGNGHYKCPRCEYRFRYKSALDRHLENRKGCLSVDELPMGPTVNSCVCPECEKRFATPSSKTRHQKRGHCRRPVLIDRAPDCPWCHKVFSRADSRARHVANSCPKRIAQRAEEENAKAAATAKQLGDETTQLKAKLALQEEETARLNKELASLRGDATATATHVIVSPAATGGAGGPVSTSGDRSTVATVGAHSTVTQQVDNSDRSTHIHLNVYGREEMKVDDAILAYLEHEMRNTRDWSDADARMKLVERTMRLLHQKEPQNRTISGGVGSQVRVHLGDGRWALRESSEVARTQVDAVEGGPLRQMQAAAPPPLTRRALETPLKKKSRAGWESWSGPMLVESIAQNNELRARGEEVDLPPA